MATDMEKYWNLIRMLGQIVEGMTFTLHDLFEDAAMATMNDVGKRILEIMENEMGMELEGETPEHVLNELGRLFEDEMGLMQEYKVERNGSSLTLSLKNCVGWNLKERLKARGVEVPIQCPIMNVGYAGLTKMGFKNRRVIEPVEEAVGCKITYTIME